MQIELSFPPSSLSGHAKGHWRSKANPTALHRRAAYMGTLAEMYGQSVQLPDGDILIAIHFYPPDNRGDRVNYPNRCKPIFDGVADALDINDKRFLPSYHFHECVKGGKVVVTLKTNAAPPTSA